MTGCMRSEPQDRRVGFTPTVSYTVSSIRAAS